jgi:hypothetical protein
MPVSWLSATERTNLASWRGGESFSPPTDLRVAASSGVSAVGTPSANRRTVRGSRVPSSAVLEPTMSLVNMAWTSAPAALNWAAMYRAPYRPCSSPATAAKTIVDLGARFAITLASSMDTATPDASSSAPGASAVAFMTSVTRES